jgi:hypothetical protein
VIAYPLLKSASARVADGGSDILGIATVIVRIEEMLEKPFR